MKKKQEIENKIKEEELFYHEMKRHSTEET